MLFARASAGFEIVGVATDAKTAEMLTAKLRPEIVIVDIDSDQGSAARFTKRVASDVRVIWLSGSINEELSHTANLLGVFLVALKHEGLSDIVKTVCMKPPRSERIENATLHKRAMDPRLTPRELEILTLIAQGLMSKEIAGKLNLSTRTVECHREHIGKKLGIHGCAGLVKYAIAFEEVLGDESSSKLTEVPLLQRVGI